MKTHLVDMYVVWRMRFTLMHLSTDHCGNGRHELDTIRGQNL